MPLKDRKERARYQAQYMKKVWYPKNKEKHLGYIRKCKERVAAFIERYKREGRCADCGFVGKEFPYVLDFDHGNGLTKKFNIGNWRHSILSIEAVRREMQKCELVCANCHRIRTFSKKLGR